MIGLASGTVAVACLAVAVTLWSLDKGWTPRAALAFLLAGCAFLVGTGLGRMLRDAIYAAAEAVAGLLAQVVGGIGVGLVGIAALCLTVYGLWTGRIAWWTVVPTALLPFLAVFIPGPAGETVVTVITRGAEFVSWPIRAGLGI